MAEPNSANGVNGNTGPGPTPLTWKLKICYGLGHVWNDLCASLWFTYLLLFLKFALGFDENSAGVLMLIGQVADAIATPLAGLQVDKKYSTFNCWKYGHRKTWHLIGTFAVLVSFPFIFENCLLRECAMEVIIEPIIPTTPVTLAEPSSSFTPPSLDEMLTGIPGPDYSNMTTMIPFNATVFNTSTIFDINGASVEVPQEMAPTMIFEAPIEFNYTNRTVPSPRTAGKTAYYAVFIAIFQFGWAAVQIAHLSLIPCLTHCQHQRTELNAIRYGFTVLSNIAVYSIAWIILGLADQKTGRISPKDTVSFRNISLISSVIGAIATVFFHVGVKEDPLPVKSSTLPPSSSAVELTSKSSEDNGGRVVRRIKFYEWFKTREFYEVAVNYQVTRLFFNLSQVYITLYLQETLSLGHQSVAVIPLIMFLGGFAATFFMKKLNKRVGRKVAYGIGFLLGLVSAVWIWVGDTRTSYKEVEVYFVAVLLGASGSILLVTSLSITADLIGPNSANGGFIYGAMSFADKMTNGFAIMLIQYLNPCQNVSDCPTNPYPGTVLVIGCGGSAIIGMIGVLFMKSHDHEAGVFNIQQTAQSAPPGGADRPFGATGMDNPAFGVCSDGDLPLDDGMDASHGEGPIKDEEAMAAHGGQEAPPAVPIPAQQ